MPPVISSAAAVVVAAGRASRMGGGPSKVFLPLAGYPLLYHSIQTLHSLPWLERIVLVVRPRDEGECLRLIEQFQWKKCAELLTLGGEERFHSVRNGLARLADTPPELVAIHDAARPLLTPALALAGFQAANEHGAAVVAVPAVDTVKLSHEDGFLHETPNRRRLWQVQTPQTFRFSLIWPAYRDADEQLGCRVTDDAELLEQQGHAIRIVPGSRYNIKVTVPEDIFVAQALLAQREAAS